MIPLTTKLHVCLYDATCVSLMLYNSWAARKEVLNKLDACHHRHLRAITGHRQTRSVTSNDTLYKMCQTIPPPPLTHVHEGGPTEMVHVRSCVVDVSTGLCCSGSQQIQCLYRMSVTAQTRMLRVLHDDHKQRFRTLGWEKNRRELTVQLAKNKTQWCQARKDWLAVEWSSFYSHRTSYNDCKETKRTTMEDFTASHCGRNSWKVIYVALSIQQVRFV